MCRTVPPPSLARACSPDCDHGRSRGSIVDLSDERRSKKPWLPADDRDVTNGLVVEDEYGKPACVRHGAMNRVDPFRRIYRCSEMYCGVGAEIIPWPGGSVRAQPPR
jgi:hypothetical protein